VPGIIGVTSRLPDPGLAPLFERMFTSMDRGGHLRAERLVDPGGRYALGRTHLGVFQPEPQLSQTEDPKVLFHGELHNQNELLQLLDVDGVSAAPQSAAAVVAALYRQFGDAFAARLRGSFCVAILDTTAKRLVLASDLLGSYPLYWFGDRKRFVFASELRAVLRAPDAPREIDPRAVADYLVFGFPLGKKTLTAGVEILPAASILTADFEDERCEICSYRTIADLFGGWEGTREDYVEAAATAFARAADRAVSGNHEIGLALSGGIDSRAILAVVDSKRPIATYTLGLAGCADEKIAERLSRIVGTPHRFHALDVDYLREFLPTLSTMVALTDGMYLTHGLTEMLALRALETSGFSILLRGHGGELAKTSLAWPLHTDETIHAMRSVNELIPYLFARAGYVSRGVRAQDLFTNEWATKVAGAARASLEEAVAGVALEPADLCSYLYLIEHHRRFTISSLELFRNLVEVRMPFVDEEFLGVLFRGSARWRDHPDIHRAVFTKYNPALGKVRNSNTGAAATAPPFVEAVLDKMNTLFKRLRVPGYRHYHEYEAWTRRLLLDSVDAVLLEPRSLARGILREDTLRVLLRDARQGTTDHAYLFQVLLNIELWQRADLDAG
jgi:asparagine synthase (glutamine-hydrolysing)